MSTNLKPVPEVDFDKIKTSLKTWLSTHSDFVDHNFEGSALATMLDVLSYNTHFNAMYDNMAINESFLDSAIKRSSVVSRAKEAGYVPYSTSASEALINATIVNVLPEEATATRTILRGTKFIGQALRSSSNKTFVVVESKTTAIQGNAYSFNGVKIKAGELVRYNHIVTDNNRLDVFELPHQNVDIDTIQVFVQPNNTSAAAIKHNRIDNIFGVSSKDPVFWVQEGIYGQYDVYFGDGVLGRGLNPGEIVQLEYLVADPEADGIRTFAASGGAAGFEASRIIISTSSQSAGGAQKESILSIKRNAPLFRAAQNRCVTSDDYISLLRNKFPLVDSIAVWGGEENSPPVYGKVFISIKPRNGYVVSQATKNIIIDSYLKLYNVASITPEYVDPDYIHVSVAVAAKYKPGSTTASAASISSAARPLLQQYFASSVNDFNKVLRYIDVQNAIRNIDASITSANTVLRLQKRIPFTSYKSRSVTVHFSNPLEFTSITTQEFVAIIGTTEFKCVIRDEPRAKGNEAYNLPGDLWLYTFDENNIPIKKTIIGEVSYNQGLIHIPSLAIASIDSNTLIISANLRLPNDVVPKFNQLVVLDDLPSGKFSNMLTGVTISLEVDQ